MVLPAGGGGTGLVPSPGASRNGFFFGVLVVAGSEDLLLCNSELSCKLRGVVSAFGASGCGEGEVLVENAEKGLWVACEDGGVVAVEV